MKGIIIGAFLLIAVFVGYSLITTNWDQVLKIEDIDPKELETGRFGDPELKLTFTPVKDEDIENYKITTNSTNSSGKFIKTLDKTFTEKISAGSVEIGTMTPVRIIQTEGTELTYLLNLYLYANDEFQEKYQVPLILVSDTNFPPYLGEGSKSLVFADLDITEINLLDDGEQKLIDFKIKQELSGNFENVRVVPYVDNNRNNFVEIDTLQEEKIFDFVGEETVHSISIKAINSEGEQIKYKMQLALLNNDELMDYRIIDVFVKKSS